MPDAKPANRLDARPCERIGREAGEKLGREQASERYSRLILLLNEKNRTDLIIKAASDPEYLETLYREYGNLTDRLPSPARRLAACLSLYLMMFSLIGSRASVHHSLDQRFCMIHGSPHPESSHKAADSWNRWKRCFLFHPHW